MKNNRECAIPPTPKGAGMSVDSDLLKLYTAFNNICFNEDFHAYTFNNGNKAISVTTLLNKFTPYFDAPKIATAVALRDGKTVEAVLQEWGVKSVISTARGKLCHAYLENHFKKRYYDINSDAIKATVMRDIQKSMTSNAQQNKYTFTGSYEAMHAEVMRQANILVSTHIAKFLADIKDSFVPVAIESVLADEKLGLAGTPDIIAYSNKLGKLIVLDWKFNSTASDFFDAEKKGSLNIDGCLIPASKYNIYSLQISTYLGLLRRAGISNLHDVGYIVHFDVEAPTYALHPTANCVEVIDYVFGQLEQKRHW